jgi:pantothenate synthetase
MEQSQHEQRRAAAKEFQQSLDELEHILQENSPQQEETLKLSDDSTQKEHQFSDNVSVVDLAAWEDAVADIEQYFQQKEKADS